MSCSRQETKGKDAMSDKIRLKGYPNGIQIVIDEDALLGDILVEVAEKFKDSEKFFGKSKKVISFEGKQLSAKEEDAIISTIRQSCSLSIVCVVSRQENETFQQAMVRTQQEKMADKAQFFRGNVGRRDILEMDQSVIILGNVESGGLVISQKDIIVLGHLQGSAYAGVDGNPHFICALHMDPETIRIGEIKGKYTQKSKWKSAKKDTPKLAWLKNGEIQFSDVEYTEELLQNLR